MSLWKTITLFCCSLVGLLSISRGQCIPGTTHAVTYDTVVAGTGNSTHSFSLPQFDPSLGTLVSATIHSVVSVNYGFTLQNVETIQRDFSVSVGRYDYFSGSTLGSPYSNLLSIDLGSYLLNPNDMVTKSPYTILYRYVNSDSLTSNMVNYLGNGTVNFYYKPITYTTLTGSNTYYYSATANDTVQFSITYYYCTSITLLSHILDFTAIKQDAGTVGLSWAATNEQAGHSYTIQKSPDGFHFTDIETMASDPGTAQQTKYSYDYQVAPDEFRVLNFRLKILEVDGQTSYSDIRTVDMTRPGSVPVSLYPNPSDQYINLVFNQGPVSNWMVEIISDDGRVLQRNRFANATMAHLPFSSRLAAGVYFARATEQYSGSNYLLKFVVR
jgi:hypothetical protein